jgi:hypothetical protein
MTAGYQPLNLYATVYCHLMFCSLQESLVVITEVELFRLSSTIYFWSSFFKHVKCKLKVLIKLWIQKLDLFYVLMVNRSKA